MKDYFPLLSSLIVITLFIIDRVIGAKIRKREVNRNWYLKVLVEPSIVKISEFYNQVDSLYLESFELLKHSLETSTETKLHLKSVTTEIGKFQNLKRLLESAVILPIQIRYPKVGEKLTDLLLRAEDVYTQSFDSISFNDDEKNQVLLALSENRSLLLNVLYLPIEEGDL